MTVPIHVVVLAAGLGKRMHSAIPKVLHPLAGRPVVAHVLDAARAIMLDGAGISASADQYICWTAQRG